MARVLSPIFDAARVLLRAGIAVLASSVANSLANFGARTVAATALALMATTAWGQTGFSSSLTFEQPVYSANEQIVAMLTIDPGSSGAYNINFTSSPLPAGLTFNSPVLPSACGGTASNTATTFSLSGGTLAADTPCTIFIRLIAAPTVLTTYTINVPNIAYQFGPAGNGTDKASGSVQVDGGIPPSFTDSIPDDGRVGNSYFYPVVVEGTQPIDVQVTGLPPGLSYDPDSGDITGTPTTPGTYPVTINASNGFAPDANAVYTIVILPIALAASKSFSPASILTGGTTQMRITLTNTTNVSLIAFNDPFPAGLSATPATSAQCGGTVTLTASALSYFGNLPTPGSCTIAVSVVGTSATTRTIVNTTGSINFNDGSQIAGVSGSLLVQAGVAPAITSGSPPNGVVGSTYSHAINVTGTPVIGVSVSGLPPGLVFNAAAGKITGVPTLAGTYNGTIVAQNAFAPNAVQPFRIVITNPPLAIVTGTLPPIHGGDTVHVPVVAQGGIPPYRFDVLSGQLPPGLAFDPGGFLNGVPTLPGVYTFTARVTDSVGTQATKSYTITIDKGTPLFTFDIAPNPAVAGQAVVATATLSGGAGIAAGSVQVWVAHSDERCPVIAGVAPVAAKTLTSALGAGSQVKFTFGDLGIDHYQVCATYGGDVRYNAANAGPLDVFVIKGALLSSPAVAITAPAEVEAKHMVNAQVAVNAIGPSAIAPSGIVLLRADGVPVGTVALAGGVASFSTKAPGVPGHVTLTASYLGDGAFPPAVAAPAIVAVTKAEPLAADPIPALNDVALMLLMASVAALGMALRRRRRG
jgi:hypothetical protein